MGLKNKINNIEERLDALQNINKAYLEMIKADDHIITTLMERLKILEEKVERWENDGK